MYTRKLETNASKRPRNDTRLVKQILFAERFGTRARACARACTLMHFSYSPRCWSRRYISRGVSHAEQPRDRCIALYFSSVSSPRRNRAAESRYERPRDGATS
jgi:hypothetical protein